MDACRPVRPDDIRHYRGRLGLSQGALALALGMSKRGVEDWEGGRREPPAYLRLALERLAITTAAQNGGESAHMMRDLLAVDEHRAIVHGLRGDRA